MKKAKLKQSINERIRNDGEVLYLISRATGYASGTVRNWFYTDAKMLTDYNTLSAISQFLNVPISELLEEREMIKV